MSKRPLRRGGGHSSRSSDGSRGIGVSTSTGQVHREVVAFPITGDTSARVSQPNPDELDRMLQQVIASGGAEGGHHTLSSSSPQASFVSSSSSTNNKCLYKGLALEKCNKARGERLEVTIREETGRPSLREQATALASEMGLACRECLPLFSDWRSVEVDLKKLAFERMNARLKLINLDDIITYGSHLRHMDLIRRRWTYRVHQEWLLNGEDARPAHITDDDWESIKSFWKGLDDQRERHSIDPSNEKRSWSEIGETAHNQVVNLHCASPMAHATVKDELEQTLQRPVGRIELFEKTRRKEVSTHDRPDGWLPGTKATHVDEISRNIVGLARTRPDIFGTTEEEVSNAVKAEIEKKKDEQPKQVIWDGHTGSIGRTTNQAMSQIANVEDQIDASTDDLRMLPGPESSSSSSKNSPILPHNYCAYFLDDKFIQLQSDALAAGVPQTDDEIVDVVLNAAKRSNCRPGAGYGPKAVGHSSRHLGSKQHLRDELVSTQKKNNKLEENMKLLMESHAKLIKDMAQIKAEMANLSRRSEDTSTHVGQPPSSQQRSRRTDDLQ